MGVPDKHDLPAYEEARIRAEAEKKRKQEEHERHVHARVLTIDLFRAHWEANPTDMAGKSIAPK